MINRIISGFFSIHFYEREREREREIGIVLTNAWGNCRKTLCTQSTKMECLPGNTLVVTNCPWAASLIRITCPNLNILLSRFARMFPTKGLSIIAFVKNILTFFQPLFVT